MNRQHSYFWRQREEAGVTSPAHPLNATEETGDRRQEVGQDRSPALTGLHSKKYRQCFVPEQWINFLLTNKTLCL